MSKTFIQQIKYIVCVCGYSTVKTGGSKPNKPPLYPMNHVYLSQSWIDCGCVFLLYTNNNSPVIHIFYPNIKYKIKHIVFLE